MRSIVVVCAALLCACDARKPRSDSVAAHQIAASGNEDFVATRADWDGFVERLPEDANAAAAALERYRQANGLPFTFDVKDSVTAVAHGLHGGTEDMSGAFLVTAFVRRMPDSLSVLRSAPVFEFDARGKIIRQWAIPGDAGYWTVVEGVVGDELITGYRDIRRSVYLYFRSDRTYRVSANPPPPLDPPQWIEIADSTWLQVGPGFSNGAIRHTPSYYAAEGAERMSGKAPRQEADTGHWVATADSGWYVRLDTVPGLPVRAHATTLGDRGTPQPIQCPMSPQFEGMLCAQFPAHGGKRLLAYPEPTT